MARVRGLSHRQIDDLIAEFEDAAAVALHRALAQVGIQMGLTAAAQDQTPHQISMDDLGLIQTEWTAQVTQVLTPQLAIAYARSANHVGAQIGRHFPQMSIPPIEPQFAEQRLAAAANRMKNTSNVVWEQTRNQLADGLAQGEGIDKMSQRLQDAADMSEGDARRVARTEVIGAVNQGSLDLAQLCGLEMEKVWIATEDMRTRASHTVADGQKVDVNDTFDVGGFQLMFPGDPTGPADEIINCRCTQGYDIPDEQASLEETGPGHPNSTSTHAALEPRTATKFQPGGAVTTALTAADVTDQDELIPDGDDDSDADVQAEQTGAMVALVPSPEDAARLAIAGGEAPDQLHLTLFYLGDAAAISLGDRATIVDRVAELTTGTEVLVANAFGAAMWNPDGADPAIVLNVNDALGGGCLIAFHDAVLASLCMWPAGACMDTPQHEPWQPHVCVAYSSNPGDLVQATKLTGPITFDRVRVAFADQVQDFPLLPMQPAPDGAPTMTTAALSTRSFAATGGAAPAYADAPLTPASPAPTGTPPEDGVGGVGQTNLPAGNLGFNGTMTGWKGILVVEGVQTGDGRMFAEGSLTWAEPPLPLAWQRENLGEHMGSVIAARIDYVWRDPIQTNVIWGSGVFDADGVDGAEALRQVRDLFLQGVSVDVDSVKDADVEMVFPPSDGEDPLAEMFAMPELMIFHNGRIRGATLCALPAFTEARIELTDDIMPMAAAAPVPVPTDSPTPSGDAMAANDEAWDGPAAEALLASNMALPVAQGAYAWVDMKNVRSGAVNKVHSRFLHHHVDPAGRPGRANVTACSVGIGALLSNPRLAMSMSDRRAAYEHLAGHLRSAGLTPQSFTSEGLTDDVRALYASAAVTDLGAPPDEAFEDPGFAEPTALTITAAAGGWQVVRGHAALWSTCHMSFPGACVTPPREEDHAYYRLGEVVTASGKRIAVGGITLGTGHAPTFGTNPRKAQEHYDNTGAQVAIVASGNDDHGIWVAGVVKPGTPQGRVVELAAAKLSGDWRRIGGQLRLVAMLAVNVPGFPVPRLKTQVEDGRQLALVAAGLVPDAASLRSARDRQAINEMKQKLARKIGRDPRSMAAQLRARVHGGG